MASLGCTSRLQDSCVCRDSHTSASFLLDCCSSSILGSSNFKLLYAIFSVRVKDTMASHLVHSVLWEKPVPLALVTIEPYGIHQQILHDFVRLHHFDLDQTLGTWHCF
jgi:hypothetical protein